MSRHSTSNSTQQTRVFGPGLPQRDSGDGDCAQDLRAEGVEDDDERAEGVPDGLEGDESRLPLYGGEDGLVAGFEEVVAA